MEWMIMFLQLLKAQVIRYHFNAWVKTSDQWNFQLFIASWSEYGSLDYFGLMDRFGKRLNLV